MSTLHGCGSAGVDGGNSTDTCLEMTCNEVQGGGEGEFVWCQRRDAVKLQLVARHATSKRMLGHPSAPEPSGEQQVPHSRKLGAQERTARDRAIKLSDLHVKAVEGHVEQSGVWPTIG